MLRKITIALLFVLFCNSLVFAEKPSLKLVYKDVGNPPYMQAEPDNYGLHLDIMQRAVEKIGFDLEVIRVPKIRTYKMLEHGDADLYASGEFKDYRSEFLYYFPNGLTRIERYYGITSVDVPEITSMAEINNYGLVWMTELGSSWPREAKVLGIKYAEIKNARIDKAIQLIQQGRPVFFKIIVKDFDEYMIKNNIKSIKDLGIRVHNKCCVDKKAPLYTNFSRFSPWYKEQPNLLYDKTRPLSAENFPFELVPESVPYKLKNALQEMIDAGEIEDLLVKYSLSDHSH